MITKTKLLTTLAIIVATASMIGASVATPALATRRLSGQILYYIKLIKNTTVMVLKGPLAYTYMDLQKIIFGKGHQQNN